MQVTKSYAKVINAPGNLFHVRFSIFKYFLSGVYTFLKLFGYLAAFYQKASKKEKNKP